MEDRDTFIAYGDLLRTLAAQCREAEAFLSLQDDEPRHGAVVHLADWVALRERSVAEGLERCAEEGPENMVMRRLQYKPEHRAWQTPEDLVEGLYQTLSINKAVSDVLQEEAEKSVPVETGAQMEDLSETIDAISRRVSMALVTSQDL